MRTKGGQGLAAAGDDPDPDPGAEDCAALRAIRSAAEEIRNDELEFEIRTVTSQDQLKEAKEEAVPTNQIVASIFKQAHTAAKRSNRRPHHRHHQQQQQQHSLRINESSIGRINESSFGGRR